MNSQDSSTKSAATPASPAPHSNFLFPVAVIWLLLVAALLRFFLVEGGGQFFFPDEARYVVSRKAAALIASGKMGQGLLLPFANSEHVGFKVLGVVPALLEVRFGRADWVPAMFFSVFSWLNLPLIWLCARRLGATRAGQIWALFLATCSVSLFYYTRHLLPYDASLCFGLTALWIALRDGGWKRGVAVGLLAGLAFITYLGYWALAGTVMLLYFLRPADGWRRRLGRVLAAGAGFGIVIVAVLLVIRLRTDHPLSDVLRFATTVNQGDFQEGYSLPWRYLLAADGWLVWLWLAAVVYAVCRLVREKTASAGARWALTACLVALGALYVGPVLTSNVLQKFVVYGRGARLEVPFFCLLAGLMLGELKFSGRARRLVPAGLALFVAIFAARRLAVPLTQQFPASFRREGDALLRLRPAPGPNSYYRYVNVTRYVMAPEVLHHAAAETLLEANHPYQFTPYLFERLTAAQRTRRQMVDHRMRLVRIEIPAGERVMGETYGMVTLNLCFPVDHAGFAEPLLSLGRRGNGGLFFVRYEVGGRAVFGLENMGEQVIASAAADLARGQTHILDLYSGTLAPPESTAAGAVGPPEQAAYYHNLVFIRLDGAVVLEKFSPRHQATPGEIFTGFNFVGADSADSEFSGEIVSAVRRGWPPLPKGVGQNAGAGQGAVELLLLPPATGAGAPEPLVVAGIEGRAVLGFIRILPDGTCKLGVEIWSVGAWESSPFRPKPGSGIRVVFSFGSLYPPLGDPAWNGCPGQRQAELKHNLSISVDGQVIFAANRDTPELTSLPVYFGQNPIGGSFVGARYSGEILNIARLPLAENSSGVVR